MRSKRIAVVALLAVIAASAQALGRGVAITPVENVAIQTATPEAAERAIRAGASRRGWVSEVVSPEQVRCRLDTRGHRVVVDVIHGADTISVRYSGSANMDYDPASETIHRKYNGWVANLVKDIQRAAIEQASRVVVSPPPPPPPQPQPQPDEESPEERIRKLFELRDAGLITDEECAERRREILESL